MCRVQRFGRTVSARITDIQTVARQKSGAEVGGPAPRGTVGGDFAALLPVDTASDGGPLFVGSSTKRGIDLIDRLSTNGRMSDGKTSAAKGDPLAAFQFSFMRTAVDLVQVAEVAGLQGSAGML